MTRYEYKVVPAPHRGTKAKGIKTPEGRFALSVEDMLNDLGAQGWEYQRAELLPSEEKSGLTGSTTNWRNVLVFRRTVASETALAETAPPVGTPMHDPDGVPLARPVPGPEDKRPPAPIAEEFKDPPLRKPSDDGEVTRTPPRVDQGALFSSRREGGEADTEA